MIRAPADTNLQPPLALPIAPINVPHPLRASNRDDRDSTAGNEHGRRAFTVSDASDVRHSECAPALRHLSRCQRTGNLAAKVREVLEPGGEGVDGVRVDAGDSGCVQTGRCRKRNADISVRA